MASAPEDQLVEHFSRKHRMIAWVSQTFFRNNVYTVRHGLLAGLRRRGGLGWMPGGSAESPEVLFWKNLSLEGQVVYDIGAFHGLLTLFFARQAQHVVAYEPNSENRGRLSENLHLNSFENVTVRPMGLGDKSGESVLTWNPLTPGGGRADADPTGGDGSRGDRRESIQIGTLDEELAAGSLPVPSFLKIDVEGYEINVLRGARNTLNDQKPELFLELHGSTMREKREKTREIVEFVSEAGYGHILHVESDSLVSLEQSEVPAQGHLYCTSEPRS